MSITQDSGRKTPEMVEVTIRLHRRPDGGLRVHSDTLPGLVLSGADQDTVAVDIGPAIKAMLEYKGKGPALASRTGAEQAE